MNSILLEAADSIIESIAADGLVALKSVLDSSGFADSEHLRDYEVRANVMKTSVEYEIIVSIDSVTSSAKESLRHGQHDHKPARETPRSDYMKRMASISSSKEAKQIVKTYALTANGKPIRLEGVHDARRPAKDARRPLKDARVGADRRARPEIRKRSRARLVEHAMEAYAPRGLDVDNEGLLRIAFQREVRTTGKSFIMPKGSYQGIVQKFVDRLRDLIENEFTEKFDDIINNYS